VKSKIEKLDQKIKKLRQELSDLRDAENKAKNKKFVGQCFRYRNSYSCPETEEDFWWMYIKVLKVDSQIHCFLFQIKKNGEVEIAPNHNLWNLNDINNTTKYERISETVFQKEWGKCKGFIKTAEKEIEESG